jgi:ligand-binding sensor domain-containing protein
LTGVDITSLFETEDGVLLAGIAYTEQMVNQFDGDTWHPADLPPLPVEYSKPVAFAQDEAGRLTIGLDGEGVLFLDGDEWSHFTMANDLPSNNIRSLTYDADGNLWIVTDQPGGVGIFDAGEFSASPELADITGAVIYTAPDGALWLGTEYEGLWQLDGQVWKRYRNETIFFSSPITAIFQDTAGLLWLGLSEHGLLRLDDESLEAWTIENEPAFNSAQQILETDDGRLWFVELYSGPEIAIYTPETDTWDTLEVPEYTQVMAFDPGGSFWFGTGDGLWRMTAGGARRRFSTDDGLPGNAITALTFEPDGGLWVGTETGLAYRPPAEGEVTWQDFTGDLPSPYVTNLYTDPDGQVWIGLAATDNRPAGVIRSTGQTISGIWLAGDKLTETLPPDQELVAGNPFPVDLGRVTAFATDAEGNLWVGTIGAELWRFSPASDQWRRFGEQDGGPVGDILTIAAAADGTIWVGTWYNGLWGFNEAEGWWQDNTEDGLPGQAIFASHIAEDGSLWVATESGFGRYVEE